jgi:PAS domain S-box-containing protein
LTRHDDAAGLRQRAEAMARGKAARPPEDIEALSPEETRHALHELRVHQIELEMQNEELRRAQAELDAARARYFDLYDLAPVGYCTINEQGLILEANLTAATLLGVARSALVKQWFTSFILPEDEDIYYLHRKQLFETGEPQACFLRMVKSDSAQFWAHLEATAVEDAGGAPVCRIVISDITERKRAEEEREKLTAQLIQAQKMESIGRLAGGVAHDFNNLLTVINGYSQWVLDKMGPDDPLRFNVAEIHKAGERAAGLTRQLLAFSRKQVLQPRVLDLNQVVREMQSMLARLVGEDVELSVALNAESGTLHADPHQLEQVILNLAVNARYAMPRGGKLSIETALVERDESYAQSHPEARAGRYVMLAVNDNGVGMDEETLQRIFEPFFTTKGTGKGTGLGLSMVQGIVAQSGGYIDVHSEPGRGTTFKIYLPALVEAAVDTGRPAVVPALGGTETVLVVEDQAQVRKYAVTALSAYGYRVIEAENAGEALSLCGREPGRIHLVLTDVVMPNVGGRELAAHMEKLRPGIKVLFMSGYTGDAVVKQGALEAGAKFIQKPFSPEALAGKVRAVLGPPVSAELPLAGIAVVLKPRR